MNKPTETNSNNEHSVTPEELLSSIKDDKTAKFNVAEDMVINEILLRPFPVIDDLKSGNLSSKDIEKYHNLNEDIIAEMLLADKKSPVKNKISELREGFNPNNSSNNTPTNK